MNKIFLTCFFALVTPLLWGQLPPWEEYKSNVLKIHPNIPGWCSPEKAERLMEFVYHKKPQVCVEIGTLAGATTFPIICTLNYLGKGMIYAIDTWDNAACIEGLEPNDPNIKWWLDLQVNMDATYDLFLKWLSDLQLSRLCCPIRMRSDEATVFFADQSIDLLYIDGNISSSGSLQDVTGYFPKVKKGGYIWLNYAELDTKNKSVGFLMRNCEWIREESIGVHWLLFRKR